MFLQTCCYQFRSWWLRPSRIPLSRYFAWIMDAKYRPCGLWMVRKTLGQWSSDWKQYAGSLLVFNTCSLFSGALYWPFSNGCRLIPTVG